MNQIIQEQEDKNNIFNLKQYLNWPLGKYFRPDYMEHMINFTLQTIKRAQIAEDKLSKISEHKWIDGPPGLFIGMIALIAFNYLNKNGISIYTETIAWQSLEEGKRGSWTTYLGAVPDKDIIKHAQIKYPME